ncbi:MAG: serine hydrolase [Streptococcus salivarius]
MISAINTIKVKDDKPFLYTDINFILLGLMLEKVSGQTLDKLFDMRFFNRLVCLKHGLGQLRLLFQLLRNSGRNCSRSQGSSAQRAYRFSRLFSTLKDLEIFVNHYLTDDFAKNMTQNISQSNKERSVAWDLQGDWILHTGYTGTFVLINIPAQRAAIFLSNRTYYKDERAQWIKDRDVLIDDNEEGAGTF